MFLEVTISGFERYFLTRISRIPHIWYLNESFLI